MAWKYDKLMIGVYVFNRDLSLVIIKYMKCFGNLSLCLTFIYN